MEPKKRLRAQWWQDRNNEGGREVYTPLISWGLYKFKDCFNLTDKDERMRMAGKGEVGWGFLHLNYLVVVVGWWWWWGGGMCWGIWGKEGGHRLSSGWGKKLKGFYGKPRRLIRGWVQLGVGPKLPGVNDFPFNYFATCARILSPGGSWITWGLNTHALLNSNTHTNWLHSSLWYSGMISPEFLWHRGDDSNVSTLPLM